MASDSLAAPSADPLSSGDGLQVLLFSTWDLPPERRYEAWLERNWPRVAPIFRTQPTEPFNTRWESAQLGPVMFSRTEITGMRYERRLDELRMSDFDPIVVSLMVEGTAQGDCDGRAFLETPGTYHFHDLGRPSLHTSTASLTYNFILDRATAQSELGPLDRLHGLVIAEKSAAFLFGLAEQIAGALSRLTVQEAERLGQASLKLLGAAIAGAAAPRQSKPIDDLRQRVIDQIEIRSGLGEATVADLAKILDVSRGRLFDAFKQDGGVQAFVLTRRLEQARTALHDTSRREAIGAIAHRLGFSDAAHLSRAFRLRYGMTPSAYRALGETDSA